MTLVGYVGDARLHDGQILSVKVLQIERLSIIVRAYDDTILETVFSGVRRVESISPEGMMSYGLAELQSDNDSRRFVFVNWDEHAENESSLQIWANDLSIATL